MGENHQERVYRLSELEQQRDELDQRIERDVEQRKVVLAAIEALRALDSALRPRPSNMVFTAATAAVAGASVTIPLGKVAGTGAVNAPAGGVSVNVTPTVQPRSSIEAAELVLREARQPLHIKQIIERMQAKGYRADEPYSRLRNTLVGALQRRHEAGEMFVNLGGGIYWLRGHAYRMANGSQAVAIGTVTETDAALPIRVVKG